jgi:hypothetical protein
MSSFVGAGNGSLGTATVSAVRGRHPDMATGDFNGDGVPDYAVAVVSGEVDLVLGRAGGGLVTPTRHPTGIGTVGALAADFDGDGKLDLAGLSEGRSDVTVSLGNGDGTFRSSARYRVGGDPWEVGVGDLNGDGRPDILATTGLPDELHVLIGTGGGAFASPQVFRVGDLPTGIATGDFNRDGKLDVALASYGESFVTVLLGDGTGAFNSVLNYPATDSPDSIVAADLTGDGILDLATATFLGSSSVGVLAGRGDGSFGPPQISRLGGTTYDLEAADLNGDGKLDLVGALLFTGHVSVLLGQGGGRFSAPVRYAAGPPACIVPPLRGRRLAQARRALRAGRCRLGRVRRAYSPLPRGRIVKQRPGPGAERPVNSRVSVTVSRGRKR